VSFSKADLCDEQKLNKLKRLGLKGIKKKPLVFSSITGYGLENLLDTLWKAMRKNKKVS